MLELKLTVLVKGEPGSHSDILCIYIYIVRLQNIRAIGSWIETSAYIR